MSDLIENDSRVLLIMSRFGIGLGVGDKTIGEVCRESSIDVETFLAIVNLTLGDGNLSDFDISKVSLPALLDYLTGAHGYYLRYRLPAIRRELIRVWEGPEDDLLKAIIMYYDEFVDDVRKYVKLEEKILFPYVRSLEDGPVQSQTRPEWFVGKHDPLMAHLDELKRILIKYYPARDTNLMNEVLFDISACQHDLLLHRKVEDMLLYPILAEMDGSEVEEVLEKTGA